LSFTAGALPKSFLAAFSSYVLALAKNSYEKFPLKTLMKLTPAVCVEREQLQPQMEGESCECHHTLASKCYSSPFEGASLTKETQAT